MQNDKFERQVQQKMDELKLMPSTSVWNKVEAALPKERKRRWVLFFLLFAAVSTTALLWLNKNNAPDKNTSQLAQQKNNEPVNTPINNDNAQLQLNEIKNNTGSSTTEPATNTTSNTATPVTTINTSKTNTPAVAKVNDNTIAVNKTGDNKTAPVKNTAEDAVPANTNNEKNYIATYLKQPTVLETVAKMKTTVQSPGVDEDEKINTLKKNDSKEKNKTDITVTGPVANSLLNTSKEKINIPEEKTKAKELVIAKNKADSAKNEAVAKAENKKKKQLWQYSLQFGFGIPYTKNGINDIAFTTNTSPLRQAPTVNNIIYNQPAKPSPGMVFQTGITIEKNIVGRLDIKTGLSYTYLSNHIRIGNKIDSLSGNGLSTYSNDNAIIPINNGPVNLYNNHFHFIQLPLALQYAVVKKEQFALFLEGGASLDYMANSNALLFDGATNTYSTSKNIFNRMLYTGLGGIGAKLAQQTRIPVTIGYQFSYGLKPFFKNADTQQHLPVSLVYFRFYLGR